MKGDERKSFFINLFNIMNIQSLIENGRPTNKISRIFFFNKSNYVIGNIVLSLNDVQFAILRNEKKDPFFYFDSQKKKAFKGYIDFDPRVNFALHFGNASSPVLNAFTYTDLDDELDRATSNFIQNEVQIIVKESVILLPSIFEIYFYDFGNTTNDIINFVKSYMSVMQLEDLSKIEHNLIVKYKKYDWSLNSKTLKEETEDVNIDFSKIKNDPIYREHFYKFCKTEFSTENIDCYRDIVKFENTTIEKKKIQLLKSIFDNYISLKAEKQINVNKKVVDYYEDVIQSDEKILQYFYS
jgi:hypothetical protein